MNENAFNNFYENRDDGLTEPISLENRAPVPSPFTIIVDSNEQIPYTFDNIIGDSKDDYSPIKVRTITKALRAGNRKRVGDYGILEAPGFCIERKSKSDLFSSVNDRAKQENFIERLRNMQENLKGGVVLIECYQSEIFSDPPSYTKFEPKSVYMMTLSWSIQFNLIHWHWAEDRESAEQLTYRLLEKFYQHETDTKYKHHNKPIDGNLEAMKQGILARMYSNESEIPYCSGNPLRLSWLKGWEFQSTHAHGGDRGILHELGYFAAQEKQANKKLKKARSDSGQHIPLPGQTSFLNEADTLGQKMDELFNESMVKYPPKRMYRRKYS